NQRPATWTCAPQEDGVADVVISRLRRYQTTPTLSPHTTTLRRLTCLTSSYTSNGSREPVAMMVRYSAQRLRQSNPTPSVTNKAAYAHVPTLKRASVRGFSPLSVLTRAWRWRFPGSTCSA